MYFSPSLTHRSGPHTSTRRFNPKGLPQPSLGLIITAIVVLMVLIDLMSALVGQDSRTFPWWGRSQSATAPAKDFTRKQAGLKSCSLDIAIKSSRLVATYTLIVEPQSSLVESLASSHTQAATDRRLAESIGSVSLAEFQYGISGNHRAWAQVNFSPPVVQINSKSATITLKSDPIEVDLNKQYVSVERGTLSMSSPVIVNVPSLQITDESGTDLKGLTGKTATIAAKSKDFTFTISEPNARQSWLIALRAMGGRTIPLADTALSMANDAMFCFLLFFGLREAHRKFRRNRNLAVAYHAVQLIAAMLGVAVVLELIVDVGTSAIDSGSFGQSYIAAGPMGVVVCGATVAWPMAAWQVGRARRPRPSRIALRVSFVINAVIFLGALGCYLALVLYLGGYGPQLAIVSFVAAALAFGITSAVISWYGLGPAATAVLALTSALLVLGTPLVAPILWWNTSGGRVNTAGKIIFLIAALALAGGLATLICRTTDALTFVRGTYKKISYKRMVMIAAVIVITGSLVPSVIMVSELTSSHEPGPTAWNVLDYIDSLTGLLNWAVLFIAVLSVMSLPPTRRYWIVSRSIAIPVLVLLALDSETYFYIPVTLIIGIILAARFCLPRKLTESGPARERIDIALSGAITSWRRSRLAADQCQKISSDQGNPPDGTSWHPDRYTSFSNAHDFFSEQEELHNREAARLKSEAFSHYGQAPDRKAATYGLYIGVLLGIPAAAVIIIILTNKITPDGYPVLDFMDSSMWTILEWPLLGWFVGYYSPIIRGSNGFEKGCCLFGFSLLSSIPVEAATYNSYDWSQNIIYFSVVFAFLVVAGIAICDILPLKMAKMHAMDWVKVNNWRFVVTWSTALVAALSTAAVTLLSTTVTNFGDQVFTNPSSGAPASHNTEHH